MDQYTTLLQKINDKKARVGIIGLGYVGKALAELLIDKNFEIVGFVRNEARVKQITELYKDKINATTDSALLASCDIILVCVQTPIHEDKSPDLGAFTQALEQVAKHLQKGQLIAIESSIAPGTTRKIALPILEQSGLSAEKDFFLCFSPERVNPGKGSYPLSKIPKVVSGNNASSLELSVTFYSTIIEKVVPVSNFETAELVKIFENTFRLINISLVNEVASYAKAIGVNMWEVVDAAATKPFGFLPHYPSPGVGGHCIPVDPFYLLEDARKHGITLSLIETAGRINDEQMDNVTKRTLELVKSHYPTKEKAHILMVGIAYKENVDDTRESAALKIMALLKKEGHKVSYYDPYVPVLNGYVSIKLSKEELEDIDLILITTAHDTIDFELLLALEKPIFDTKNVLSRHKNPLIVRL